MVSVCTHLDSCSTLQRIDCTPRSLPHSSSWVGWFYSAKEIKREGDKISNTPRKSAVSRFLPFFLVFPLHLSWRGERLSLAQNVGEMGKREQSQGLGPYHFVSLSLRQKERGPIFAPYYIFHSSQLPRRSFFPVRTFIVDNLQKLFFLSPYQEDRFR